MADKKEAATEAANKEEKEEKKAGILQATVESTPQRTQKEKLGEWRKRHGYQR